MALHRPAANLPVPEADWATAGSPLVTPPNPSVTTDTSRQPTADSTRPSQPGSGSAILMELSYIREYVCSNRMYSERRKGERTVSRPQGAVLGKSVCNAIATVRYKSGGDIHFPLRRLEKVSGGRVARKQRDVLLVIILAPRSSAF